MMPIGTFIRLDSGYAGRIKTFTLDAEVVLVPTDTSEIENAPDYRARLDDEDGPVIGAGWKRTGERAGAYVSLLLDDPAFAQPLRASLFQSGRDGNVWTLYWSRISRRDGQE